MKYTSPFHLLPTRDTHVLTNDELKRWKKELMLQFDLNKSTSIKINGKEYDKNDILQAFDLLKDSPDYHLRLYRNKPLLNFIENGDIAFFKKQTAWDGFDDIPYRDWLAQWFIPVYDDVIYKCIEKEGKKSLKKLKKICQSNFNLPDSWRNTAYQKTFTFFNHSIKSSNELISNREYLTVSEPIKFAPQILESIKLHYADALVILPSDLEELRQNYAAFTYRFGAIVMGAYRDNLPMIEQQSLQTLAESFEIDYVIRKNEGSLHLMAAVRKYAPKPGAMKLFAIIIGSVLLGSFIFAQLLIYITTGMSPPSAPPPPLVNASDIHGYFVSNYKIEDKQAEKTLFFAGDYTGAADIETWYTEGDFSDACKISADFTWVLNGELIEIEYKNIKIDEDFERQTTSNKSIKTAMMTMPSETLYAAGIKNGFIYVYEKGAKSAYKTSLYRRR